MTDIIDVIEEEMPGIQVNENKATSIYRSVLLSLDLSEWKFPVPGLNGEIQKLSNILPDVEQRIMGGDYERMSNYLIEIIQAIGYHMKETVTPRFDQGFINMLNVIEVLHKNLDRLKNEYGDVNKMAEEQQIKMDEIRNMLKVEKDKLRIYSGYQTYVSDITKFSRKVFADAFADIELEMSMLSDVMVEEMQEPLKTAIKKTMDGIVQKKISDALAQCKEYDRRKTEKINNGIYLESGTDKLPEDVVKEDIARAIAKTEEQIKVDEEIKKVEEMLELKKKKKY